MLLPLSGKFQKYDYGEEKNLEIYGQATPPRYDLTKVTAPVAMYTGTKDLYCVKKVIVLENWGYKLSKQTVRIFRMSIVQLLKYQI